jgi:predicted  nucleic acid-binding Zn-ribbon protein
LTPVLRPESALRRKGGPGCGRTGRPRLRCTGIVHADLEKLVDLQRLESHRKQLETQAAQIPEQKAALESALALERSRLEAVREELAASQKTRRQLEADLQDLEVKRSKYKGQLMEVKTNKEYTAMLHEIEAAEREIRSREDLVLVEMQKGEDLSAASKQEERTFKAAEERHHRELKTLDEDAKTLGTQVEVAKAACDALAVTIPSDALELFQRVAGRRGAAVAEARDEMCQLCHLKLRPQMWVEIRRNEAITQCPGCNRILYYEVVAASVAPQP